MNDSLEFVKEAEKGGFHQTLTSDHFHPWTHTNGYGNSTWIWLAAAAERTKKMKFTTGVTALVYRYNPGIVAQTFASLDVLYPGRIGLGVGTGEAMNEVSVGMKWPNSQERLERTIEGIKIIKKLWTKNDNIGKKSNGSDSSQLDKKDKDDNFITFEGQYFNTKSAKLYTPPLTNIPLYMAGSGEKAIQTAAKLTDGLITTSKPDESDKTFEIFNNAAKEAGKNPELLEKIGKPEISYSEDYDEAFKSCEFWRTTKIDNAFDRDINDPRILEKTAKKEVSDEELKKSVIIITSIDDLIGPIEAYFKAGFTQVYLHSTSPNEMEFVKKVTNSVLPHFNANEKK